MKIILRADGIIRSGPERLLIDDYIKRAKSTSRAVGFRDVFEEQINLRAVKALSEKTKILTRYNSSNEKLIILDERGLQPTSKQISKQFSHWRDNNIRKLILVIGGANGFDQSNVSNDIIRWAFGQQTWPHKMVRVMAAEQIYRAMSILSSTPYHRD